jgi:hypothetical protein
MIARLGTLNFSAKKLREAVFAFPCTAGARNLILMALPCSPNDCIDLRVRNDVDWDSGH